MDSGKKNLETWQIIPVGLRKNIEQYLKSYKVANVIIGKIASVAFQDIKLEERHTPVKLVRATNVDFGLDNNAPVAEICRHALLSGLKLCRPEVALSLREQYASQPKGEVWWIAAEPINSKYGPGYFAVGHDSRGLWLCFGCGGSGKCWWGRMRHALLSPEMQERLVSMNICECPWSRRGCDPITVIFEQKH